MTKPPCRVRTLAGDAWCSVDFCPGCDAIHLKVGYATLSLNPEAFKALCTTLNAALARFQRQTESPDDDAPSARPADSRTH